jgi:hypothetical protein
MVEGTWRLLSRAALRSADDKDGGGVMIDTFNATFCSCNDTAWTILQCLEKGATVQEIAETVCRNFDVGEQDAQDDVIGLVRKLQSMDLVNGE